MGCSLHRSTDILQGAHSDWLISDFNSSQYWKIHISAWAKQGATCAHRTHKPTHRWEAAFVVLSLKEGAVRLHMELSLKTKSKMRSRCRIPSACWLRKTRGKIDREKRRGHWKQREGRQKGRLCERTKKVRDGGRCETVKERKRYGGVFGDLLSKPPGMWRERETTRTQTQAASSLTSAEVSAQTSLSSSPIRLCSGADIVLSTTKRPPNWWAKRFRYQSIARRVAKMLTRMHRLHKGAHYGAENKDWCVN